MKGLIAHVVTFWPTLRDVCLGPWRAADTTTVAYSTSIVDIVFVYFPNCDKESRPYFHATAFGVYSGDMPAIALSSRVRTNFRVLTLNPFRFSGFNLRHLHCIFYTETDVAWRLTAEFAGERERFFE